MKYSIAAFALFGITLFPPPTAAQDSAAHGGPPTGAEMDTQLSQMQKDMNAMLQQIAKLRQQSQLQENIRTMQSQIDKLQGTSDPKERHKLMQEHMRTLKEHMKMIENMSGSEGGSVDTRETAHVAPGTMASRARLIYGPGPIGFPGGVMYRPALTGRPPGYPAGTVNPGGPIAGPPGGTGTPWYR